ncbi:MAG: type II toxin-antitoxin system HicA family toxin [Clostridiales bacterium]|jgi:hypothetical protein|nr:type II toxin-antitoxin system HicA family toxin [Clostridiales bacterium]
MSKRQKLISRLKSRPKDMTLSEIETLILSLGYRRFNKGRTSGSKLAYKREGGARPIELHRPHGRSKVLLRYQIDEILMILESEGLI